MAAKIGHPAPGFDLPDQAGNRVTLESFRGQRTVVVFIPFPFTGVCEGELCTIRDRLSTLNALQADVVVITCDTRPVNKRWSDENGFEFPVLSDFWPHGVVAQMYGAFNDTLGCANRYTFILDEDHIVRDVIHTDELGTAREFDAYATALTAL